MGKKGFTLIELLIVVAIIGILAVIAVPAYIGQQKNAQRSEAYANLQSLRLLEEQFMAENGRYTITLGVAGPNQPANINTIQTGGGDATNALSGFKPGTGLAFSYRIITQAGVSLPTPVPFPYGGTTANLTPNTTPCFIAVATGNSLGRVAGDVFAIDCNNNRNF